MRILETIIEGARFRLVAYPKALMEMGESAWNAVRPAVMFSTEAFREFWWALWTGEIYPLRGTAIFDWQDGFLGFAGGVQRMIGRTAAAATISAFQAFRLAFRWRWIGIPMMAVWFFQAMSWGGFLKGEIGNLLGFLVGKLFVLSLLPAALFLFLGFLRSRGEGVFPGLRYYFLGWLFRDVPETPSDRI